MIKADGKVCEMHGTVPDLIIDMININIAYRNYLKKLGWDNEHINRHMIKFLYASAEMEDNGETMIFKAGIKEEDKE